MNATAQAIIARLPRKALVSPADIASAFGLLTTASIISDISAGKLAAVKVGNRIIVSREEAARYIISKSVLQTEGTIPKRKPEK